MHSPAMLEMTFSPVLHADVVLQIDLNIPNFEVLNLNTSAILVRLERKRGLQGFTHLPPCTWNFFESSFFYTISTNISTHVLTRFVFIAHKNLFGKRLVFLTFSSFFSSSSAVLPLHPTRGTTFSISGPDAA